MVDALLDTSIVVDLIRGFLPALQWSAGVRTIRAAITPIIWMETLQGAQNRQQRDQIMRFLRHFPIEHPTPDDNRWAMRQLARFHLSHNISFPDIMIASVAVRLNVPLYTLNIRHYEPLPNMQAVKPY